MENLIEEFLTKSKTSTINDRKDYDWGLGYSNSYGHGNSRGYGDGDGSGYGDGSNHDSDYGYGHGFNSGDGIKSYNKLDVHMIDKVQTIITHIRSNIAQGFILQNDLILYPCYVVKQDDLFAHGNSIKDAQKSLDEKLFESTTVEERISLFKASHVNFSIKYSALDLSEWHRKLTGSCRMGVLSFCNDNNIDINIDEFTVYEFIELTKDSYEGDIIERLSD